MYESVLKVAQSNAKILLNLKSKSCSKYIQNIAQFDIIYLKETTVVSIIEDKTKYQKRVIDKTIETYLQVSGSICIEGPKWCGKTWTSAFHSKSEFLVGDPNNNFQNRQLALLNPTFVLQGDTPRLIDEWQEVPSLWDATRSEVDKRKKKGQIILTGSSTPKQKGVMHGGSGRIVKLRMNTMSLYEAGDSSGQVSLFDLCNGSLDMQMVKEPSLNDLAYYIVRGGWPENISISKDKCHLMPRAYMKTLLDEDIKRLDEDFVYNRHKMELLLKSLARNESTTASELSIWKDVSQLDEDSMSRNTLSKYLDALDRLFILNNQVPYSPSIRSSLRVKQQEKRHLSDPAMACAMLNITSDSLINDLNTFGFLFEALVEHDLSIYANSFGGNLFHYQDYKNHEIDAVIELEDSSWCAFEIKLGASKIDEGANNLNKVCSDIVNNGGKPPKIKCVICGLSNAAYKRSDGVYVVPITALKD